VTADDRTADNLQYSYSYVE